MDVVKTNLSIGVNKEIAKQVYHINQLIPFPLTDIQIEDIAKSLEELIPELTPQQLKKMIDRFKFGYYEWDKTKGIQNIFKNLSDVMKDDYSGREVEFRDIMGRFKKPTQIAL